MAFLIKICQQEEEHCAQTEERECKRLEAEERTNCIFILLQNSF
ncbi:MAG: hypothetical protein AABX85_02315 [Nanoarchaeota archaeon]